MRKKKKTGRPLLRWAGSKRQVVPLLMTVAPRKFDRYVEPFAGSAALFFALSPADAVISDSNAELVNFYRVFRDSPIEVDGAARALSRSTRMYKKVRAQRPQLLSRFDRAVRFYYLNRLCFNGVYRVNQRGEFNVPKGSKVAPFPKRADLKRYAEALKSADIRRADFADVINQCGAGDFVYADPPYYRTRHRGEYGAKAFGDDDARRLVKALKAASRRGASIALSYVATAHLRKALVAWKYKRVGVWRNVAANVEKRGLGAEALFLSYSHP